MSTEPVRYTLSEKAVAVVAELEAFLGGEEFKITNTKDLYTCENSSDLFQIMKRLVNEMDFLPVKVLYVSSGCLGCANSCRTQFLGTMAFKFLPLLLLRLKSLFSAAHYLWSNCISRKIPR